MNRLAASHTGSRTIVLDPAPNERAPAVVVPHRAKMVAALENLARQLLPSTPEEVKALTRPRESLSELINIDEEIEHINMHNTLLDGEILGVDNIMHDAIHDHMDHDTVAPESRDAKWLETLSTLLNCAMIDKIVTQLGDSSLGDYEITTKLAAAFMKYKVDSVGDRMIQNEKRSIAAAVVKAVSRDGLTAMWEGLPMAAEMQDMFPIGEACLHFVRATIAFLMSMTDAFTQRPYLQVEKVNDALQKRFLTDIDNVTSLIHTLLQGDSPKFVYYVVWKMFNHMGMRFDESLYPVDQPTLTALNIRTMITSFLVSNVLTLLDDTSGGTGMSREMFDVLALSITNGLMKKSTANEVRSGKAKSTAAAGALVATQTSTQLSGAVATMLAVDIDKAGQTKGMKVMAPAGMDIHLILLIANTMQKLSKLKVAHAGSMKDAIQSVLNALVEINVQTFQHDAAELKNIAHSLRASVLPICVARTTDETSCLRDAVLEFTTHMTADSSKAKRDQIQPSLTRYLVMPLASANALAPKIIERMEAAQARKAVRADTKRGREIEQLVERKKDGALEITPALAAKYARL